MIRVPNVNTNKTSCFQPWIESGGNGFRNHPRYGFEIGNLGPKIGSSPWLPFKTTPKATPPQKKKEEEKTRGHMEVQHPLWRSLSFWRIPRLNADLNPTNCAASRLKFKRLREFHPCSCCPPRVTRVCRNTHASNLHFLFRTLQKNMHIFPVAESIPCKTDSRENKQYSFQQMELFSWIG